MTAIVCICKVYLRNSINFVKCAQISMYTGTLVPVYYGHLKTNSKYRVIKNHCPDSRIVWKFNDSWKTWVDLKVHDQFAKILSGDNFLS